MRLRSFRQNGTRTWREFNAHANQLVRVLRKRGVQPGDGVALLAHNGPEFAEVWAATQRAGFRLTAVNWHQSPELIAYVVDNCDAKALIASARFVPGATQAADKAGEKLSVKLAFAGAIPGFDDYDAALGARAPRTSRTPSPAPPCSIPRHDRPAQGVYRKTRPVVSQLTGICNETAKWNPKTDISLLTGPLYHAAPLGINFVIPINAGVAVLLMDKWDAEETLRLIQDHKATHTHIVPTMMHRMLQLPEATRKKYDISSMRWIIHGAAPCPAHVKQQMMEWFGPTIYEYYSSTEGGGVFVGPHEWLKKPGTVGKAVPGVEIKALGH